MELNGKNISKTYADKRLFDNISFSIKDKQKIGLIGNNGSGKSSLLKIIAELESFDENNEAFIKKSNDVKIAYLKQEYDFSGGYTVMEYALQFMDNNKSLVEEFEIIKILNKFGISETSVPIESLSGGQKRRVTLALTLLINCNLLILDEPTNHLDQNMIQWLEAYLIKSNKAILMITHDRYFLKRICNTIWEIQDQDLYKYKDVNYDKYIELKSQLAIDKQSQQRKLLSIWKTELKYVSRGAKARSSKNKIRMENFENIEDNLQKDEQSDIIFSSVETRLGNEVITLDNLSKSYNDNMLFQNFSFKFNKHDKVAIVGPNGCGKSTFLKTLIGEIKPDSGSIKIGSTVNIGYFSQENNNIDENIRVIDYINSIGSVIKTTNGEFLSTVFLDTFNFDNQLKQTYIKDLSGGQKSLVRLIGVLLTNPNVLILDEPTNDLDLDILLALEQYLIQFSGVIICVSHDRYFIDKISDYLFVIENNEINTFTGQFYDYYLHKKEKPTKQIKEQTPKTSNTSSKDNFKEKFSYKEKEEFKTIDDDIEKLENELKKIDNTIMTTTDFQKLQELTKEREVIEINLQEKFDRWYYLNEKNEKMSK